MQKWEYCKLVGIGKGQWEKGHSYPELIYFTAEGEKRESLSGKDQDIKVAKKIMELGLDGWEMVAVAKNGDSSLTTSAIWFKRPVSN